MAATEQGEQWVGRVLPGADLIEVNIGEGGDRAGPSLQSDFLHALGKRDMAGGDVIIDLFFRHHGRRGIGIRQLTILLNVVQFALEVLRQAVSGTGLLQSSGWLGSGLPACRLLHGNISDAAQQ